MIATAVSSLARGRDRRRSGGSPAPGARTRAGGSIAAVAEAVGYQSPQYFADSFRRFAGMSPQQFRKLRAKRGGPRPPGP